MRNNPRVRYGHNPFRLHLEQNGDKHSCLYFEMRIHGVVGWIYPSTGLDVLYRFGSSRTLALKTFNIFK